MRLLLISITAILVSCSSGDNDPIVKEDVLAGMHSDDIALSSEPSPIGEPAAKNLNGVHFVFKEIDALSYLERSGSQVAEADKKDLSDESVFMLEYQLSDGKSPKESPSIQLSPDQMTQYFMGNIIDDFSVSQGKQSFKANGVQYDGEIGNKLRVVFFFKGVDIMEKFEINYHDRLFGRGSMKLIKTNEIIS